MIETCNRSVLVLLAAAVLALAGCDDSGSGVDEAGNPATGMTPANGPATTRPAPGPTANPPPPMSTSDDCKKCMKATDCSSNFCNRVARNDLAQLIGASQPMIGRCSAPGSMSKCACTTGVIANGKVCIGTGCPPGMTVDLCDHLSGMPF